MESTNQHLQALMPNVGFLNVYSPSWAELSNFSEYKTSSDHFFAQMLQLPFLHYESPRPDTQFLIRSKSAQTAGKATLGISKCFDPGWVSNDSAMLGIPRSCCCLITGNITRWKEKRNDSGDGKRERSRKYQKITSPTSYANLAD